MANQSLHNIDWVMIMKNRNNNGSAGGESKQDRFQRNELLRYGLGLGEQSHLGRARITEPNVQELFLSDADLEYLRTLNRLDYKLWDEAIQLNRLDVISIQRMKPYYAHAVTAALQSKPSIGEGMVEFCCGLTCRVIPNSTIVVEE